MDLNGHAYGLYVSSSLFPPLLRALQFMMNLWGFFTIAWSRVCNFRLQCIMPIIFKSSSTEFRHLTAGLSTR
jgi:hypothetical protein